MNEWATKIAEVIPDFDPGRFRYLTTLDCWQVAEETNCRLVLDYAGRFDITLIAKGVSELPTIKPAATPGILPYAPYDLGEFMIAEPMPLGRVVIFDELKGWRFVANAVSVERICDKVESEMED